MIGIFGLVALLVIWLCFPETSHPGARGIDKLRREAESGARILWTRYVVNPVAPLGLLRAPNILAVVSSYIDLYVPCVGGRADIEWNSPWRVSPLY